MNVNRYRVNLGKDFKLTKIKTHSGNRKADKKEFKEKLSGYLEETAKLQNKLFAEDRQSLLIILQGMDSAGKDGTIKAIMSGLNPQGVLVHSFKHPSTIELEHDFLWRHAIKLPEHGQITIFNRSHYENVLISKVHPEIVLSERLPGITSTDKVDKSFWNMRYKQINYFEEMNTQNGTCVVKFFLHLSKQEQRNRFLDRIENKEKHWKFSSEDIAERRFWNSYQDAYEQTLKHTSTKTAPWYIIPADDKQFAHLLVCKIILEKLKQMNPSFPPINKQEKELMQKAKKELIDERGH